MPCNPHRMTRTARTRSRKFSGRCESCGKPLCSCRAYQYTDENNGAITANAPYLCRDCYETRYGVKISVYFVRKQNPNRAGGEGGRRICANHRHMTAGENFLQDRVPAVPALVVHLVP